MKPFAKKGGRLNPLSGNAAFRAVYGRGGKSVCRYAVVYVKAGSPGVNRFGTVASKKVGGAVVRNKARRRIKEILRKAFLAQDSPFHHIAGFDIIVVARPAIANAEFTKLSDEITQALSKKLA